jgi:hypothetical protein
MATLSKFCLLGSGCDALDVLMALLVVFDLGVKEGLKEGLEDLGV